MGRTEASADHPCEAAGGISLLRVAGGYPAEVEEAGRKNFLYLLTTSSMLKRNFRTAELTRKLRWFQLRANGWSQRTRRGFLCSPARDGRAPGLHAAGTSGECAIRAGVFVHDALQFPGRRPCGGLFR